MSGPVETTITVGEDAKFESPQQRLSAPDHVDWHMILDQELSQLSQPETGIIGSIGFVGLGGAIGLLPAVATILDRLQPLAAPQQAYRVVMPDVVTAMAFAACVVLAIVCLTIFGLSVRRNWGLAAKIRGRKKFQFPAKGSAEAA